MTPPTLFSDDIDIHKLNQILAMQDAITDLTSMEGLNGIPNDLNPMAYTAATENNPNLLTQKQMLADMDKPKFVIVQQPEINRLQNANVFKYMLMSKLSDLPHGTQILNTIWSYQ